MFYNINISSATAVFVGVYEPTKQKLLKSLPENVNALAHLVRITTNHVSVYNTPCVWQISSLRLRLLFC